MHLGAGWITASIFWTKRFFTEILKTKQILFKPDLESLKLFQPKEEEIFCECWVWIDLWVGDLGYEPSSLSGDRPRDKSQTNRNSMDTLLSVCFQVCPDMLDGHGGFAHPVPDT